MKPNILFILADDMGYGDFSAFNDGLSQTPVLDDLIQAGTCLSQHYTASPVCNPSRACLLTGRYPHRTGSIDTLEWRGLERLALRETTLADVLKSAGYRTGLIGKWHLGAFDSRYHPARRGFDESVCFRGGMHDYTDWRLEFNERVVRSDGRYLTDVWSEEAVSFIKRQRRDDPFFLHLTYNAPHTPLQVPDEEKAPFAETGQFTDGVSTLYGMLKRMDRGIGQVLEALEQQGLSDNTIVVFSSDNGPQFGGEGENCLNRYNCDLHGAKCLVYEGGIRVPGIISWPDGMVGGRRLDTFMHFGDWKLVRPAIPETMQAPCVNPWLDISMYEPERLIRDGLLKEPEPPRTIPAAPPPELYNLAEDPCETRNLADTHPAMVQRLSRQLDDWFAAAEADRASIDECG